MKIRDLKFQTHSARTCTVALLMALGSSVAFAGGPIANGDFNGDGYDDMLVGIPYEDVGTIKNAGAVSVFYGTAKGLNVVPALQIHQDSPKAGILRAAIMDKAEANDHFGRVIAVSDFNNDGYDDAAISAPREGVVHILYGSQIGIHGPRNSILSLQSMGYSVSSGRFGDSLAVGDINGDGYVDLAIGAPNHSPFDRPAAGGVMVKYGSANGLKEDRAGTQFIFQRYPSVPGDSESYDFFGKAVAMADFNQDGYADLAIGIPNEDYNANEGNAGGVALLYGGANGILGNGNRTDFFQDSNVVTNDKFGEILTTGDFDGNGYPDLAIGNPAHSTPFKTKIGSVTVISSTSQGLDTSRRQQLSQGFGGGAQVKNRENYDYFGSSLTAGDFNGDNIDDLAVGAPFEDHERRFRSDYHDSGQVSVFYGGTKGFQVSNYSRWHQDTPGVAGKRSENNRFGYALGAGDFNNDRVADLVVSVPGEDLTLDNGTKQTDVGTVLIFYGQFVGLSTNLSIGQQVYSEPTRTVGQTAGRAEQNDGFGGLPKR